MPRIKNKHTVTFLLVLFISVLHLEARHIIGGEMSYEIIGEGSIPNSRNYRFTMKIYRDCAADGAPFDSPAEVGLYRGNDQIGFTFIQLFTPDHAVPQVINAKDESPCLVIPPDLCVESAVYEWLVFDLPIVDVDYVMAYRRCCRNNSISNIVEPESSGATFYVNITPEAQSNSNISPEFDAFPPIVICINEDINFDHSATDADGDQLIYSFCSPKLGGGDRGTQENVGDQTACDGITPNPLLCSPPFDDIIFVQPTYTFDAPMGGAPTVTIDPNTGIISGIPNVVGQFVVGVCVEEFRQGILIGSIQRDFQFNVIVCEPRVEAFLTADTILDGGTKLFQLNSCGDSTLNFINLSQDIAFIDSTVWKFDLGSGDSLISNDRDVSIDFPGIGSYSGQLLLNPGLSCSDTANIKVNIFPSVEANFDYENDTCVAGPVSFSDLSLGEGMIDSWTWDFGDSTFSATQNPEHNYANPGEFPVSLLVSDQNGCTDQKTNRIPYFPAPEIIIVQPDRFVGCTPRSVNFNNLSSPIDNTYDITWNFGDGQMSNEISPEHFYDQAGTYSISLEIISPSGCSISRSFNNYIEILPGPTAGFNFSPMNPSSFERLVNFTDQSSDAVAWNWIIGDESTAFVQNPSHSFRDTGLHRIVQIVAHESGCTDSAFAVIDVDPRVNYALPNAFTPNFDGLNDEYIGKGSLSEIRNFSMSIWNRWGEKIFLTNDPFVGWNGRKNNTGLDSPQDVYSVYVEYKDPRGKIVQLETTATLIR